MHVGMERVYGYGYGYELRGTYRKGGSGLGSARLFLSHALFFDILVLSTCSVVFSWDFVIAEAKWEYLCRSSIPIEILVTYHL
jgi:hypothetical protein